MLSARGVERESGPGQDELQFLVVVVMQGDARARRQAIDPRQERRGGSLSVEQHVYLGAGDAARAVAPFGGRDDVEAGGQRSAHAEAMAARASAEVSAWMTRSAACSVWRRVTRAANVASPRSHASRMVWCASIAARMLP